MKRNIYSIRSTDADAAGSWQDGMVLGNGRTGVVCSCTPLEETFVFQNMDYVIPRDHPRFTPPEVTAQLEEARQSVIKLDDTWDVHDRQRTQMYCFHPGARLRMKLPGKPSDVFNYRCVLDDETGELTLTYSNGDGNWTRKTFVSRKDDVVVTKLANVRASFSIDDVKDVPKFGRNKNGITPECFMKYRTFENERGDVIGLIAHYPDYEGSEMAECGYLTISKSYIKNNYEEVILLSKTYCLAGLGKVEDFDAFDESEIVRQCETELDNIANQYRDKDGNVDYDLMFAPHARLHRELFDKVELKIGDEACHEENLANEEIIEKQKSSRCLLDEMVMRVYAQGREALIESCGYSAPRLCGLWTGEWNPGWNGAYTMDANVNIQVSGMNTGHIYDASLGYIYFVLKQVPDWENNAELVYGMKDAIQIPVNTDGRRAMMVEYDKRYLFQYWNAGASWMMIPIFEFWQCYGNQQVPMIKEIKYLFPEKNQEEKLDLEKDILRPLLLKTLHFWQQLCTPEYFMDAQGNPHYLKGKKELAPGEKYMLVPAYSPENIPKDYQSTVTANAAMDIAAARDCLKMVMSLEGAIEDQTSGKIINDCRTLLGRLPEYLFDETGAVCEWSYPHFKDNNAHRHISHLYMAWPGYEAQDDLKLRAACKQAIENRNKENQGIDDTASHGWIHKALVAARLKDGACVQEILLTLFKSDIFYNSLMTDHNTNRERSVYCTDTIIGLVGVINEALLYSNDGVIEFLPALPSSWKCGEVKGLMARTRACVESLKWDTAKDAQNSVVTATIVSYEDQDIKLLCPFMGAEMKTSRGETVAQGMSIHMNAGERITVAFIKG